MSKFGVFVFLSSCMDMHLLFLHRLCLESIFLGVRVKFSCCALNASKWAVFCWLGHIASTIYGHMKCIFFSAWSSSRKCSKLVWVSCAHTTVQLCRRCACCSSRLALLLGQATSNKKYRWLARSLFTTSLCDCNLPQFLMLKQAVCAIMTLSSCSNIDCGYNICWSVGCAHFRKGVA